MQLEKCNMKNTVAIQMIQSEEYNLNDTIKASFLEYRKVKVKVSSFAKTFSPALTTKL